MAQSAISLCSKALIKLGARPIVSFSENTAEAELAQHLYQPIRDALLSAHPWRFATSQVVLARLAMLPMADYAYAYQLPRDFLRALSAGQGRGQGLDYRIHEDVLHTNAPEVLLTYIFKPAEESYPPFFDDALVARLAAEFCLPLTESTSRAEFLFKQADKSFAMAKLIDAQQAIPNAISDFSLIGVRG